MSGWCGGSGRCGEAGVLLTNLANRVQPIIRYDLGDGLALLPEPCPCGSPLPVIHVEGRQDETLSLRRPDGGVVALLPMALASLVEATPGVRRYQVIQSGPETLSVRLEAEAGADPESAWRDVESRLRDYLSARGLQSARVERAPDTPRRDPVTGKFRQVWAARGTEMVALASRQDAERMERSQ